MIDPRDIPERPSGGEHIPTWSELAERWVIVSPTGTHVQTTAGVEVARERCAVFDRVREDAWAECRAHAIAMAEKAK